MVTTKIFLFLMDGVKFIVSSQHGKDNISRIFLNFANKFGYEIKEIK